MALVVRFIPYILSFIPLTCTATAVDASYAADFRALIQKAEPWPAEIAIPRCEAINKEKYRETAEVFFKGMQTNAAYYLAQPKPYPNMGHNLGFAIWYSRMYSLTGSEDYAKTAAGYIEHAHRLIVEPQTDTRNTVPGWDNVRDLYWIDRWLKKSAAYPRQHQQWVRDIALKACPAFPESAVEYGAFNRSFGAAVCGEALLALVPNAPDADKWRKYIETVWNYWWQFRDNDESTDHYNALWFRYLLDWVEIRNYSNTFWADRGIKRMMERYLYQVFPMGAFPHYSDSCGWNVSWGHWVWIFESCATAYRDGRYKWAAHRIYDYGVNRIEKIGSWSYTGEEAGWSLLKAYEVADDTIPEKPRDKDIVITRRHKMIRCSEEERIRTRQFLDLTQDMVPDKMLMYGGSDPNSLSLMVDVVADAGHSHNRRPTLLALADHQSVLLMSLGYMERNSEDHNIPFVNDYDGYPYDNTEYHLPNTNNVLTEATALDLGPVGYGVIRLERYQGYPATLAREIVFIKDVGVIVKDTLNLSIDLKLRWGSLYRARNVGPDYGSNWINTYLGEWIPLRGLGKNAAVYTRWHNSPRDLLIYYLPDKDGKLEVVDESGVDKTSPVPLRVQYTLRQSVKPNTPVYSTTLLLPHPPGAAKPLADKVNVLLNEPTRTALKFLDAEGGSHFVVINHSGKPVNLPGFQTDGQVACVQQKAGKVTGVALLGGKQLVVNGQNLTPLAKPARAEVVPGK